MLPIDLLEVVSEVISRNGRGLRGRFVTTQYSVNCPPSLSGIHCITNFRLPKVWPLIIYKLMVITKGIGPFASTIVRTVALVPTFRRPCVLLCLSTIKPWIRSRVQTSSPAHNWCMHIQHNMMVFTVLSSCIFPVCMMNVGEWLVAAVRVTKPTDLGHWSVCGNSIHNITGLGFGEVLVGYWDCCFAWL